MTSEESSVRSRISSEAKSEITSLSGARTGRFMGQVALCWAVIATSIYIAVLANNIFVTLLAIVVIATRQNVFGLLTHEQAHYLGLTSKYGDWICNALVSYPLLILSVENYSKVHLAHHHYFFSQRDPDFHRKSGENWTFPMPRKKLLKLLLKDATGLSLVSTMKGKNNISMGQHYRRKNPTPIWFKLGYFATIATVLTLTHTWIYFLMALDHHLV